MNYLRHFLLLLFFFVPVGAMAHVGYLIPEEEFSEKSGFSLEVIHSVFSDPVNVLLMILTVGVFALGIRMLSKTKYIKTITANLEKKEMEYQRIFPWIIRLSLGIALLGAGASGVLISPVSQAPKFMFIQTLLGFLLLTGFLLEFSILFVIGLFFYALFFNLYLIGNLDFLALAFAFFFIGDSRPGIDDLLEVPCYCLLTSIKDFLPLILRLGIGIGMIFLAIYEKLLHPIASLEVVHEFALTSIIPVSPEMWVVSAGIVEMLIGLALLLGIYTRVSSIVAFIVLSLSFFFFGEDVYSHVTLFGVLSILVVTGGNKWSIDEFFLQKKKARR